MQINEIEKFLHDTSSETLEQLAQQARRLTRQRFGNVIQLYAPLYISNECIDTCTYCGFSRPNDIERKTLAHQDVVAEADYLISQGFRHLLLVAGEHPKAVSTDYLIALARELRPRLAALSIEVAPFEVDEYVRLTEAGIDGVVIYQETYNRNRYLEVHRAGPKRNYEKRLEVPERAASGGARRIGMGILLGLSDWRQDAVALIDHVRCLQKKYWQVDFQVSLPRLRPCSGGISDPYPVSNTDFTRLVCILRLALPEVGIVLSTRESQGLRDGLMSLGITQMSAGSRTEPGGYLGPEEADEQFLIRDHRSAHEVAVAIKQNNLEPVWKDWDPSLHG
jgi:2-iminoacetate synthase